MMPQSSRSSPMLLSPTTCSWSMPSSSMPSMMCPEPLSSIPAVSVMTSSTQPMQSSTAMSSLAFSSVSSWALFHSQQYRQHQQNRQARYPRLCHRRKHHRQLLQMTAENDTNNNNDGNGENETKDEPWAKEWDSLLVATNDYDHGHDHEDIESYDNGSNGSFDKENSNENGNTNGINNESSLEQRHGWEGNGDDANDGNGIGDGLEVGDNDGSELDSACLSSVVLSEESHELKGVHDFEGTNSKDSLDVKESNNDNKNNNSKEETMEDESMEHSKRPNDSQNRQKGRWRRVSSLSSLSCIPGVRTLKSLLLPPLMLRLLPRPSTAPSAPGKAMPYSNEGKERQFNQSRLTDVNDTVQNIQNVQNKSLNLGLYLGVNLSEFNSSHLQFMLDKNAPVEILMNSTTSNINEGWNRTNEQLKRIEECSSFDNGTIATSTKYQVLQPLQQLSEPNKHNEQNNESFPSLESSLTQIQDQDPIQKDGDKANEEDPLKNTSPPENSDPAIGKRKRRRRVFLPFLTKSNSQCDNNSKVVRSEFRDEKGMTNQQQQEEIREEEEDASSLSSASLTPLTESTSSIATKHTIGSTLSKAPKASKVTKSSKVKINKEELNCPIIVSNIHQLREAVLVKQYPLRDVGFRLPARGIGSDLLWGRADDSEDGLNDGLNGVHERLRLDNQEADEAGVSSEENKIGCNNSTSNSKLLPTTPVLPFLPLLANSNSEETVFHRHDPIINGTLSSFLTCTSETNPSLYPSSQGRNETNYKLGIELINTHPVLQLVKERRGVGSTPLARRAVDAMDNQTQHQQQPHLALVIEGGGMRGAVSAGMAAALSTLDLVDSFDSIHGSSAGAIVGAYLVSRQLCMDVYTDIMPAAGNKFVSKRNNIINFGVDWLSDLIERKLLSPSTMDGGTSTTFSDESKSLMEEEDDELCVLPEVMDGIDNGTDGSDGDIMAWWCMDHVSSVELAMGNNSISSATKTPAASSPATRRRYWSDDHYDGLILESIHYLYSTSLSFTRSKISQPLTFGIKRLSRALKPAFSALDITSSILSSMRQYVGKPGMNLTFVLDGIMDETHGLRPFDMDAFRANDVVQPLYVVASTVNEGGAGEMETVAFNSAEGDFFGLTEENSKSDSDNSKRGIFTRLWRYVKKAPFALYSLLRNSLTGRGTNEPLEQHNPILPIGTNAMFGLSNRRRKEASPKMDKVYEATGRADNEGRKGLFPCLEASMLVPGAAGPPISLIRSKNRRFIKQPRFRPRRQGGAPIPQDLVHLCYDAFCYESIPYRSAVEKAGATHALVLRSRPDGCVVETRQHLYEKVVGPIYFRKHGLGNVAKLFSSGGSQYRYIEDVMTLDDGLAQGIAGNDESQSESQQGVKIPPTKILFGTDNVGPIEDTDKWKRAHLLPITLPYGTPELPALSQDKDEVLRAVRYGYAAAFDVLAPIAGLPFDSTTIPGERVAELLFPDGDDELENILDKRVKIRPSYISNGTVEFSSSQNDEESLRKSFAAWIWGKREARRKEKEDIAAHPDSARARMVHRRSSLYHESDQYVRDEGNFEWLETEALLAALPGFRGGRLDHIADGLLSNERMKDNKKR